MAVLNEWFVLLLIGFCQLVSSVSAASRRFVVDWTPDGVAKINSTISLRLDDRLVLRCPPYSFSNLVVMPEEDQMEACNSTLGSGVRFLRGSCIGLSKGQSLTIHIIRNPLVLNGSFSFTPGTTSYFASFSEGTSLASSYNDMTSGGECLNGLHLTVHIEALPTTSPTSLPTSLPPEPETESEVTTITYDSVPKSTTFDQSDIPSPGIPSPDGLSANGSTSHHKVAATYDILACTLLAVLLRLRS